MAKLNDTIHPRLDDILVNTQSGDVIKRAIYPLSTGGALLMDFMVPDKDLYNVVLSSVIYVFKQYRF
jgi:hypothetical protein